MLPSLPDRRNCTAGCQKTQRIAAAEVTVTIRLRGADYYDEQQVQKIEEGVMPRSTRMAQSGATVAEGHHTTSEAAVDGLLAGAAAGGAMAAYLVVAGLVGGAGPLSILARFDLSWGKACR